MHVNLNSVIPLVELDQFICQAKDDLDEILGLGGRILYSSVETLQPGDLYLIGLNPGADPDGLDFRNIEESLDQLPNQQKNTYLDDAWDSGSLPGSDKLQRRVAWLLEALGFEPRRVCASNLIFARSRDERSARYPEYADVCWPVHERILKIVQPRAILCFGKPFDYLVRIARVEPRTIATFRSGHGNWQCKAARAMVAQRWLNVIGVPHLSRYDIIDKAEVVECIKQLIEKPLMSGLSRDLETPTTRASIPRSPRATQPVRIPEKSIGTNSARQDSSDIPYSSRMFRTRLEYSGRGKRADIWKCWPDGCTVEEFVKLARAVGQGGPEDLRIYWRGGHIRLDPPPTVPIRPPR
jgi:hypothetical protein